MKFKKLKDESGSTMILAIFLVVLVSIVIISFSMQVGNQIKSTVKANEDIQEKYDAESEIENGISKFIEGIKVVFMDDIYKDTGTKDQNGKKIYEQYIYYKVEHTDSIEYDNLSITNDIDKNNDGITILQEKKLVTEIKQGGIIKVNPEFDSSDVSAGVVFTLGFSEAENDKNSEIYVKVKNISGEAKNKEKCSIDYEVKKWRS